MQLFASGAGSYAAAEAANATPLQAALNAVNAPAEALLGRKPIGNGANATTLGASGEARRFGTSGTNGSPP